MPGTVVSTSDEVAQHLLGVLEVGDHPVAQGAHRDDVGRRAPEHAPCLGADGQHLAGALADCHHRGLVEDDPSTLHVHERVGGAEVDANVGRPHAQHGHE